VEVVGKVSVVAPAAVLPIPPPLKSGLLTLMLFIRYASGTGSSGSNAAIVKAVLAGIVVAGMGAYLKPWIDVVEDGVTVVLARSVPGAELSHIPNW